MFSAFLFVIVQMIEIFYPDNYVRPVCHGEMGNPSPQTSRETCPSGHKQSLVQEPFKFCPVAHNHQDIATQPCLDAHERVWRRGAHRPD
jgi:hypothetical protein